MSQNDRLIQIMTDLSNDTFIVLSFYGTEEISGLFSFELELASKRNNITFDMLAGKNVTISLRASHNKKRYFNGIVVAFSPTHISKEKGFTNRYSAIVKPSLYLLDECYDCRIFQDKDVPSIIKEVLSKGSLEPKGVTANVDHRFELTGSYPRREFCVQYNESDLNFISRLCEEEGIFYFFKHEKKNHTLIFADSKIKHKPFPGNEERVRFHQPMGGPLVDEVITSLQHHKKLTVGKYVARDYDFTMPDTNMTTDQDTQQKKPEGQGERYEYPGGYDKAKSRGDRLAVIRMEASDALIHSLQGSSTCRGFVPGYRFLLVDHPQDPLNDNRYVFTKVRHQAKQDFTTSGSDGDWYANYFSCIPHEIPFRPMLNSDKPRIPSSQTAIVTGPKDEEIHTDKHGRVKVKFFWDRRKDEKGDGNMSCWIRVSQNWAGKNWGAMHIPRVGQEVIVNFLDGDPDRPIITGRVYHGGNMPPYELPLEKTKSTIMSSSSKGGNNSNEIGFEDLAGQEILFTHAARDQNEVVENDMSTEVKNNQEIKVEQNRDLTVASGNETITIDSGTRDVKVRSDEKHTNAADFGHKVSGSYTLKVNGNITIDASGIVKISGAKIVMNG
jgi:type VI secretion system secreted protein VgrG